MNLSCRLTPMIRSLGTLPTLTKPAASSRNVPQRLWYTQRARSDSEQAAEIPPPSTTLAPKSVAGKSPPPGQSSDSQQLPVNGHQGGADTPRSYAMVETILSLGAVFVSGMVYMNWYKQDVLRKIDDAFKPGYDPVLAHARPTLSHETSPFPDPLLSDVEDSNETSVSHSRAPTLRRHEQDQIDLIVSGKETGHYYLLLGPKGSGKTSMLLDAMEACNADGASMCWAHPDLEVFRFRLGKTINYKFNEDTQTMIFQRRDPREGGPALDIERALFKLERAALAAARERGKPWVLIINNIHFFQNSEEGKSMILQLQQKAETWAARNILTVVFTTDDFWPFHVMRRSGSRMKVLSISDLTPHEVLLEASRIQQSHPDAFDTPKSQAVLRQAVALVGRQLSHLKKVSSAQEAQAIAGELAHQEKTWLLSQIGLIPDCDDDSIGEQKWSSCSWLLLREFVRERERQIQEMKASKDLGGSGDLPLPSLSWYRCRQIMGRADFIEELDRLNIISIDIDHNVRPNSNLVLVAAQEVVNGEGFGTMLHEVRERIEQIESSQRTRELIVQPQDLRKHDLR